MKYKFGSYIRTGFTHSEPEKEIRIDIDYIQIKKAMEYSKLSFTEVFAEFISHEHIHHACYQIGGSALTQKLDNICSNWIYNNVNIDDAMRTQSFWHGGLPEYNKIKKIDWMVGEKI